ncbi:SusC/RagA family TonB-linked outer membrane protein [Hymenobacter sp. BRD67]|uniref:SusC/RagA family TonB-linked outer membrane protein n=1 Tax=Hymenobacter sp. BRD67 TaxID=2675877 RepID=UPI0015646DA2|nr:SusC/RagA family TonB-linked outer membrane protein [Hymenobacter sp. BRD67]QKG51332.1 SusC/RagA family TonB-linked outer membrane protein [Hymenobacter sp. BRD67]
MSKHLFWVILLLAGFCHQAWAQDRNISGKITDRATGQGLPGVTIIVKGMPTIGTSSNADGAYSLSVPSTATTLVYSFVGYATQEATITGVNTVSVALATDTKQLNEVVVTALGVEKNRNQLAFAATQIEGGEVTQGRNPDAVRGLEGKVAGLDIVQSNALGGSSNVVIRGIKSLGGNNSALFVVDGVPISNSNTSTGGGSATGYDYGNAASDVNPDDIATVTVLKGSAATALYGSRGAQGVILITTKRGRKTGLGVTVNTTTTVGRADLSTFIHYQKQYGAGYGRYYSNPSTDPNLNNRFDVDGSGALVVPTYEDASYGAAFNPNLMVRQWDSYVPGMANFGKATPWVAAANDPTTFFQTAVSTLNSVFVDGGDDRGTFKIGFTDNNDKGYLANSDVRKDQLNFAGTLNLSSKLTVSTNLNFSRTAGLGRYGTGYGSENLMTNFRQWWEMNVDMKQLKQAYDMGQDPNNPASGINNGNVTWNFSNPSGGDLSAIYWNNPYWVRYQNYEQDTRYRTFGNVVANYKFANWFNVLGRVTGDSYDQLQEERSAVGSTQASYVPYYSRYNATRREFNYDLIGNFKFDLSPTFSLNGLIGTNMLRISTTSIQGTTNGGLVIPGLYSLNNSASPIPSIPETQTNYGVDAVYANATLGFKNQVFLDLTVRRDLASTLPTGNNIYYYPSVALGYVFSEALKDKTPWLSYGKARINYAEVGNFAPALYVNSTYTSQPVFGTSPVYRLPTTRNNADLRPERTRSYEAGLELAFLQNRLGFDATVYQQSSFDQILPVNVPATTGYLYQVVNAGEIRNRGVEVGAFVTPVQTEGFKWTVNANFTHNQNVLLSLPAGFDNLQLATYQQGVSLNATVGQPVGQLRGTDYIYTNGQRTVGANGQYLQTTTANANIGNINPRWRSGITNTFTYKAVSLRFLIDIRTGGQIYSLDRAYGLATGLAAETAGNNDLGNPSRNTLATGGGIIQPGVMADGTPNTVRVNNADYGLYGYVHNPNAGFVYDASFVKLREVALTFALPSTLLSKIAVKGIDFSIVGRNLWIIHKNLPDADPEDLATGGGGLAGGGSNGLAGQGFQSGAYPAMRTIGANIRLSF